MKKKKQKRRYKSRYQSGGLQDVSTNLSDTTISPIQRGQQSGLLSNPQNIMQQLLQKQQLQQQVQQQMNMNTQQQQQQQQQHQAAAQQQSGRGPQQLGPRLFQAGGMYADNTVSAAGQGGIGTTANIVFDQSNPGLLRKNLSFLEDTKAKIQAENEDAVSSIKEGDEQSKIDIEQASTTQQANVDMVGNVIGTGLQAGKMSGLINKDAGSLGLKDAMKAYKAQRAINLAAKTKDIGTAAGTAGSGVQAATTGSGIVSGTTGGVTSGGFGAVTSGAQTAETVGKTGSAVAAGLGTLAKNPNVYALAAQYGGNLIKKGADDKDATTWTRGEAIGDVLGTAGKYAGYGATIGAFGGPLAPITSTAGAIIGATIGTGVGIYKGLTGRNKAREEERVWKQKRKKQVDAYNEEVTSNLLTANTQVRTGELEQKTYSGYDLGRNVVAQMGGMRMGTPRYGYAV